jgi:amino acid transporter
MVALPGEALVQLIVAGTILPALVYGSTVVLYLSVRKRLERKEGGFSLGRFELPVAIAALIWTAFALFALVTPTSNSVPMLVDVGLILAGGIYFGYMLIFSRKALDIEPADDVFAAAPEATV